MQKVLTRSFLFFLSVMLLLPGVGLAVSANDIVGTWVTEGGKSHVQISKQGSQYVGKLIWLKEPNRDGKPKVDKNNGNAALRTRPVLGLSLLQGFVFKGDHWENGKIYNPEDGKEYSCSLKLKNATTLEVRGYVFNPALGKTQTWKRK
ncbi:MAG: DUF2147 domain-containing protein [Candidatus Melainabacteria bacterium HGW-Melainabacteria-1]|nr:MAG: DUF2147 domain-containing protein [Candidatus Melainabacteria bacterium HGW-Melainabacteria-1]